jgi:hypothetical protein
MGPGCTYAATSSLHGITQRLKGTAALAPCTTQNLQHFIAASPVLTEPDDS